MKDLVYILSLSHSGSTLLNLILGCNEATLSLGEILKSIRLLKDSKGNCTCGERVEDCIIWGQLIRELNKQEGYSKETALQTLFRIVDENYGTEKTIIDSSKILPTLAFLREKKLADIKVLFVLKDVRNFVLSQLRRKELPHLMKKDGWRRIYTTSVFYNIVMWYLRNKKIKKYLDNNGVDYFQFGYEELCFFPEEMLKKISEFMNVEYSEDMLYPYKSNSHVIRGNIMRRDAEKLKKISYDCRWMYNEKLLPWGLFLYPLMRWNKRNVYKNLLETSGV